VIFFVGDDLCLSDVSYERIRWTARFTWFRSPEHNTLRLRENESCIAQVLAFSLGCLEWPSRVGVESPLPLYWHLFGPFIVQG
jgi:hypothetical protein